MPKVVSLRSSASSKRAGIRQWMKYFPLKTTDAVIELFEAQLSTGAPDLACLSLVLGALEVKMTSDDDATFPQVNFTDLESLYQRFLTLLRRSIPANEIASCHHGAVVVSSSDIVHKVSNVVWSCLSGSYHKDRAHIQSLYSLLTGSWAYCSLRRSSKLPEESDA